jgi:farnesyl diphosphate synthase
METRPGSAQPKSADMSDTEMLHFHAALSQAAGQVETVMDALLPQPETRIMEAMRYAALSGGKRMRAFLVMESCTIYRVPEKQAARIASAVEFIHAYSLVHDDLPCMDDDDLRRGKPTVHVKWDEATAVLVGDALQTLAFETLTAPQTAPDANTRLRLIRSLAQASGSMGMVGGQGFDIEAERASAQLSVEDITELQSLKTGQLFRWSAEVGPVVANLDPSPMAEYARALGLAFQVWDDVLDVEGDPAKAGKRLRKDASAGKATFVALLGLAGAKQHANALVDLAIAALDRFGSPAENLRRAARFSINREG